MHEEVVPKFVVLPRDEHLQERLEKAMEPRLVVRKTFFDLEVPLSPADGMDGCQLFTSVVGDVENKDLNGGQLRGGRGIASSKPEKPCRPEGFSSSLFIREHHTMPREQNAKIPAPLLLELT